MPEYKPLTAEEKQAIIDRHHYTVDKFNERLGGAIQYQDEAILAKLEDPKVIAVYRMNEQAVANRAERERIYNNMVNEYGRPQGPNSMSRTIVHCFRIGDDAYNEKLYQEYLMNPDKVIYRELNKVLNIDIKKIYDMGNDPVKIGEFYLNNTALCENAFAFLSIVENSGDHISKGLKEAVKSLSKPIETLNEFGNTVKFGGIDGLALPEMTTEQYAIAMSSDMFVNYQNTTMSDAINLRLGPIDFPHDYYQKFIDYGLDISEPEFLLKYKAVQTDPETGVRKQVSFEKIFDFDDPNTRIERRSPEEIFQIKAINKAFLDKYAEKFQADISNRLNQMIFNVTVIEDQHKGNWFERNILHSTSPEWTDFMTTFKQFNDPGHANYMRKDILREKAKAYREHQREQGYESLEDMKGTSLKRGTLAQAVIDTCDDLDNQEQQIREDIEIDINTGFKGKVGLFINAEEVDVMGDLQEVEPEGTDLDKSFELEENQILKID